MKKKYKNIDRKALYENTTIVTDLNVKAMPNEVKEWFELIKDDKIFFPKKYYSGLKLSIKSDLVKLFKNQPNKPLKDVIAKKIKDLNPIIPADKLLELTEFIIKTWQKLKEGNLVVA